jgi:hypothetical protein
MHMPTRLSRVKEAEKTNALAVRIVAQATGQTPIQPPVREKNAAAVALGKLGASKGGQARAQSLSKARRKAIARNAAKTRWSKL